MSRRIIEHFGTLTLAAALLAAPAEALALRRAYEVLFVSDGDLTADQSRVVDFVGAHLGQSVTLAPPSDMDGDFDLAPYDLVLWHYHAGTEVPEAGALAIETAQIPLVVVDGPGFPISHALGLTEAAGDPDDCAAYPGGHVAVDREANAAFHFLAEETVSWSLQDWTEAIPDEHLRHPCSGAVNTVPREAIGDGRPFRYTRPLMTLEGSSDEVVALVNDKRRAAVSGMYDTGDGCPDFDGPFWKLLHRMLEYATAVAPEFSPAAEWIDAPAFEEGGGRRLFSPSGQVTLSEADWSVRSRGFDFTVERTYRGGKADLGSYTGPSWTLNHDRYLVHDTFNDQILVRDGRGGVVVMDQVQGDRDGDEGTMTFVAVGSAVTDVAVYHPRVSFEPATRSNPPIEGFDPDDLAASMDACLGRVHETVPGPRALHRRGFLLRDASGAVAFFAHHEIRIPASASEPGAMAYGNQRRRTKDGELEYYRLAYLEDANGNRQNYYYAERPWSGEEYTPEDLPWCVVDTEGRGHHFDASWKPTRLDVISLGEGGPRMPWIDGITSYCDWSGSPSNRTVTYTAFDGDWDHTRHGLILENAFLPSAGGHGRSYGYDFEYLGSSADRWRTHLVPISWATDWEGRRVHRFGYEEPVEDAYAERFYAGRMISHTGGDPDPGFLDPALEVETVTDFHYHVRPGIADRNDLEAAYGWVSMVSNGVGETVVFNGRYHAIEYRLWYTPERSGPEDDPFAGTADAMVEPCWSWDPGAPDPLACPAWTWTFATNYDGQIVEETDPDGLTVRHEHLLDEVVAHLKQGPCEAGPADDRLLAFWEEHWHLRQWLANEIATVSRPEGSRIFKRVETVYEPVFNQPLEISAQGTPEVSYRYDYMEGPERTFEELVSMMRFSHAADNDPWPSYLLVPEGHRFAQLPSGTWGSCSNDDPDHAATLADLDEGNPICEIRPATSDLGDSAGRDEATATFAYDEHGRQVYSRNLDGQVSLIEHGDWTGPDYQSYRRVSRVGDDPDERIDTWYFYDERNRNTLKMMPVDDGSNPYAWEMFSYDGRDRLVHTWAGSQRTGLEREEERSWDRNGNATRIVAHRCPEGACQDGTGGRNEAGDEVVQLRRFDSKGRLQWDCREIREDEGTGAEVFACTVRAYDADDRVRATGRLGECSIPEGEVDPGEALAACAPDWSAFDLVEERLRDGRRLAYEIHSCDPSDCEATSRTELRYHDRAGRLAAESDFADSDGSGGPEWTAYEHDGFGRLVRRTEGLDRAASGAEGAFAVAWEHDLHDKVVRETRGAPDGADGTDASFGTVTYRYDERRDLVAETALQHMAGDPQPEDPIAVETYYSYDQSGRLAERVVVRPDGRRLFEITDRDAFGRVVAVEDDAAGIRIQYARDHLGRVVLEQRRELSGDPDADDLVTVFGYVHDAAGNLVSRTVFDGFELAGTTLYERDGLGYLVSTTDPEGRETRFDRDGEGREVALYERVEGSYTAGSVPMTYDEIAVATERDPWGNPIARTDSDGNTTELVRDARGDVVEVVRPDGFYQEISRNPDGQITGFAFSDGREIDLDLDRFGRPVEARVNGELDQEMEYDGMGRAVFARDRNLGFAKQVIVEVERTYDTLGNLVSDALAISGEGGTEAYETAASYEGPNVTSLTYPSGVRAELLYGEGPDLPNRMRGSLVGGEAEPLASFEWLGSSPLSRLVRMPGGGSVVERYHGDDGAPGYDARGDLVLERLFSADEGGEHPIRERAYGRDLAGRLVLEEDATSGDPLAEYAMDEMGRVVGHRLHRPKARPLSYEFDLDRSNNVRSGSIAGLGRFEAQLDRDGMNQYEEISYEGLGLERQLEYDAAGNLAADSGGPADRRDRAYTWDAHGRLASVDLMQNRLFGTRVSFVYDAFGRRVRKLIYDVRGHRGMKLKSKTDYHLFGDDVVEEVHEEVGGGDQGKWMLVVFHDPTAVDSYLRWDRYGWDGEWFHEHSRAPVADVRNNVVAVVDESGYSCDLVYDLNGNLLGAEPEEHVPYRFSGRRYDEETGLYYYRTRYYAPDLARFISVDTTGIWGDPNNYGNGYAYVGNMANDLMDPSGEHPLVLTVPIGMITTEVVAYAFQIIDPEKEIKGGMLADMGRALAARGHKMLEETLREDYLRAVAEKRAASGSSREKRKRGDFETTVTKRRLKKKGKNVGWVVRTEVKKKGDEKPFAVRVVVMDNDGNKIAECSGDEACTPVPVVAPGSSSTAAPDAEEAIMPEDLESFMASGRIGSGPGGEEGPNEYLYDRIMDRSFFRKKGRKGLIRDEDDGRTRFDRPQFGHHTNWEERLSIHDPGVVDPVG